MRNTLIRHFGILVRNIELVDSIITRLGFSLTYNEMEKWGKITNIRKYISKGQKLELIQNDSAALNSFHICFEGKVPEFMEKYTIIGGDPLDKSLLLQFVDIGDSIYFEFVRNKNDV